MKPRATHLQVTFLAVALALMPGLAVAAEGSGSSWIENEILAEPAGLTQVFTDGYIIVWATHSGSKPVSYGSITSLDITTGHQEKIGGPVHAGVDFHQGNVAWSRPRTDFDQDAPPESYGVFVRHIWARQDAVISADVHAKLVGISYDTVVWTTRLDTDNGQVDAIGIRLLGEESERLLYSADPRTSIFSLDISGTEVFWTEIDPSTGNVRLMRASTGSMIPTLVQEGQILSWAVGGETLAYAMGDGLHVVDLPSGKTSSIAPQFFPGWDLSVSDDGRYVFGVEYGLESAASTDTLWAYDLQTNSSLSVAAFTRTHEGDLRRMGNAAAASDVLVWGVRNRATSGGSLVNVARLADRIPTGFRMAPPEPDPGQTYYLQSGHYLGGGFRDFWEANGGLPVFGFPLTEEFLELNHDTHWYYAVQFTERQRFEWHPDIAGTPYQVLLGRLGAELLTLQGRDWTTFPTADPASPHFFSETSHAIAPEFWAYWASHGLEFGDPGVTFRESLALFGYPISEPMLETNSDGDTVITQYFERAVFEFHPQNTAPYDVLLRRLGAEMLNERGW
jgi:hypothetical protein